MKLIDADREVTVLLFDAEHEEGFTKRMTIADALDALTEEGCPEEVPPMSDSTEVTPRWPKTYLCDPRKNVRCTKGITCFMNGGPCQETTREEYATDPATQAALMGYVITEDK